MRVSHWQCARRIGCFRRVAGAGIRSRAEPDRLNKQVAAGWGGGASCKSPPRRKRDGETPKRFVGNACPAPRFAVGISPHPMPEHIRAGLHGQGCSVPSASTLPPIRAARWRGRESAVSFLLAATAVDLAVFVAGWVNACEKKCVIGNPQRLLLCMCVLIADYSKGLWGRIPGPLVTERSFFFLEKGS